MRTIAQKARRTGSRLVLAAALVASGALVVQANESTPATALIQHDAVTLFKGVMLRTGPVAEAVYGKSLPMHSPAGRRFERDLIREIRRTQPGFFARFERGITSGDHLVVTEAIDDARDVVRPAFATVVDADLADLTAASSEKGLHPLDTYTNTYVHQQNSVNQDYAVNQDTSTFQYMVVALELWIVIDPEPDSSGYRLERDLVVDRIVQLLSTR